MEAPKPPVQTLFLDFGCGEFKKFADEASQLTLVVNRAQAYKWKGDEDRCKKIMRAVDWSAKGDQFRLADAVLAEDWDRATKVMKRIRGDGPVDQTEYRDWPLFQHFRKQDVFLKTYEDVFGEAFAQGAEVTNKELPAPPSEPEGGEGVAQLEEPEPV